MGDAVTVGCKMPNGLRLALTEEDGSRTDVGVLKGNAIRWGEPNLNVGGYALTEVPVDAWERWFEQNKDSSIIRDHLVFVQAKPKEAEAQAKDLAEVPAQFSPIDPDKIKGPISTATKD
jgi:hypothetical protein